MNYIELKPKKNKSSEEVINQIRISFSKPRKTGKKINNDRYILSIYIGNEIAKKLNFESGNKISFSYDDRNRENWFIRKSNNGIGFTLSKQTDLYFKTQITWDIGIFRPKEDNLNIRDVGFAYKDGGIEIYTK